MNYNSLERFTDAQKNAYAAALKEVQNGKKLTHWMWYIFPQLRGLGQSHTAYVYGIIDIKEAKEYLAHPVLGARLIEITEAVLACTKDRPEHIFGHTDAIKLRSSMTLFACVSEEGSVFHKVLEKYYAGNHDKITLSLIQNQ